MIITEAGERSPALTERLLALWERSVRATHTFLSEAEILRIREYVPEALAQVPLLITAETVSCRPAAFMGLDGQSLEMLFVDPEAQGQGIGGRLVRWGMERCSLERVTVNEQNPRPSDFTGTWAFRLTGGPNATSRAAPIPCCICA